MSAFWPHYHSARNLHGTKDYAASTHAAREALAAATNVSEQALGHWLLYANAMQTGNGDLAIDHLLTAIGLEPDPAQLLRLRCALVGQYSQKGLPDKARAIQTQVLADMPWPGGASSDYDFTRELWFAQNHGTFRSRLAELAERFETLELLEVGSLQGMSACYMVDYLSGRRPFRLTCVDPEFQPEFAPNIAASRQGGAVQALQGKSQDILGTLPARSFHFLHIDGWHVAPQVLLDAFHAMALAVPGGVILFDDYLMEDRTTLGQSVRAGVAAFREVFEPAIEVLGEGRQFICRVVTEEIDVERASSCTQDCLGQLLGTDVTLDARTLPDLAQALWVYFDDLLALRWPPPK